MITDPLESGRVKYPPWRGEPFEILIGKYVNVDSLPENRGQYEREIDRIAKELWQEIVRDIVKCGAITQKCPAGGYTVAVRATVLTNFVPIDSKIWNVEGKEGYCFSDMRGHLVTEYMRLQE